MHRKLITACLAAFALAAFALPTVAQAVNNPVITHPTGTVLAPGVKFEGTNIGETLMRTTETGAVQLTCPTATITGTLTKNATANVQGEISSATFKGTGPGGECTGMPNFTFAALNLPWCLKSNNTMVTDEFTVTGAGCAFAAKAIEFTLAPTDGSGGHCVYRATKPTLRGSYTTHPEDAKLRFPRSSALTNEEKSTELGFTKVVDTTFFKLCAHSFYLEIEFTLETDTTNGVADPLYISS